MTEASDGQFFFFFSTLSHRGGGGGGGRDATGVAPGAAAASRGALYTAGPSYEGLHASLPPSKRAGVRRERTCAGVSWSEPESAVTSATPSLRPATLIRATRISAALSALGKAGGTGCGAGLRREAAGACRAKATSAIIACLTARTRTRCRLFWNQTCTCRGVTPKCSASWKRACLPGKGSIWKTRSSTFTSDEEGCHRSLLLVAGAWAGGASASSSVVVVAGVWQACAGRRGAAWKAEPSLPPLSSRIRAEAEEWSPPSAVRTPNVSDGVAPSSGGLQKGSEKRGRSGKGCPGKGCSGKGCSGKGCSGKGCSGRGCSEAEKGGSERGRSSDKGGGGWYVLGSRLLPRSIAGMYLCCGGPWGSGREGRGGGSGQ
mmetsp:Transcript_13442/g.43072  ORF Transcript_13442/g.43072 Transcript_13442/m.43072 type:complete len:374 (-) Transcript_13442:1301-2422(-)